MSDHEDSLAHANLEHLEDLAFQRWTYPDEWLTHLLDACKSSLRRLAFSELNPYPNLMHLVDVDSLRALEVLLMPPMMRRDSEGPIAHCYDAFNDLDAKELAEHAPNLRELDLSQTQATGVGIKALVHKVGKPLRKLAFDDRGTISFDAVSYARKNGIEVVVRGGGTAGKGKKVRYSN